MLRRAAERKSTRNLNISQRAISGFDTCLQFAKLHGLIKYSVLTLKSEENIKILTLSKSVSSVSSSSWISTINVLLFI